MSCALAPSVPYSPRSADPANHPRISGGGSPFPPALWLPGYTHGVETLTVCLPYARYHRGFAAHPVADSPFAGAPNPARELVAAFTVSSTIILCPQLGWVSWGDFDDALDRDKFVDMVESRNSGSLIILAALGKTLDGADSQRGLHVRLLYSLALHSGRRCMKAAGLRLHALLQFEVFLFNSENGKAATKLWREY
ncbi:hypothetical protein C8F04DRAFT_1258248 [Mycena alexandri]|uniref:Uncharacterized protein n=1 Tax=Mycena alexandri TaxID=1745969 RepID=A0AAD6SYG0_9AGAR|nr:hypothetical protein C8F04DRAFT_1258248 [Mycena alexandri]